MRKVFIVLLIVLIVGTLSFTSTIAQESEKVFIPIGGGYGDTFDGVIAAGLARSQNGALNITVLPITYATDAESISAEELTENLDAAENRRSQLEEACLAGVPEGTTCKVQLAPIFTRPDALDEANLAFFPDDLTMVYILGGDQTIAMQVVTGTPIEEALAAAYQRGVIIAGTSAGLSVQNKPMIGGYVGDFGPESGLNAGAVDMWNSADRRGLSFGLTNVLLEQHFWERSRLSRLLNALVQPDVPRVGVGVDGYTAAEIINETTLGNVFGLYNAAVLDAETFDAAAESSFENDILSIHNVLFHLIAPGDFSYDLTTRQPSLAELPDDVERSLDGLTLPEGAGALLLTSLTEPTAGDPVLTRFLELSGGAEAKVLLVAVGYATEEDAQLAAQVYGEALGVETFALIVSPGVTTEIPPGSTGYSGIMVISPDQAAIQTDLLRQVVAAWNSGKPLLLNDAAAAVAGTFYSAQAPTPESTDDDPYADIDYIQGAFFQGSTEIKEGLGLLPIMIEPRVMDDYRWGRLTALAYEHTDSVAVGLGAGAGLEISANGAAVIGANGVFTLDLRGATLALGTNNAYVVANGLLDVFAPGETLAFSG
ncbi:MAG: Type 1 glutamine amidotransferase-like domain-containing protein [Anaerolineae bacterium]|nr:Type 1 glutamine amidotransferase-like domain-containing protein [Anaerolineae bacterium]